MALKAKHAYQDIAGTVEHGRRDGSWGSPDLPEPANQAKRGRKVKGF